MKKSIAFITEFANLGGGETNLFHLAKELGGEAEVTVFCPAGALQKILSENGIKVIGINRIHKGWIKGVPILLYDKTLIEQLLSFDVIHAYSLHVLPRLFWIRKRRPVVWTTHGYWEKIYGLRSFVISRIVTKTIAVSNHTALCLKPNLPQCEVVPLGVPLSDIPDSAEQKNSRNTITLCCIGRFQKIKGQDLLLEAAKIVADENKNMSIELILVGDAISGNREDLRFKRQVYAAAEKLRTIENLKIVFEGFRQNTSDYYQKSDFVVIPSQYESFSMVAIEALAHGKCVVAPNTGGPKDIVNSERVGVLFNPGDVQSLSGAITKMIVYCRSCVPSDCIARANDFSIQVQARRHLKIYKELIG